MDLQYSKSLVNEFIIPTHVLLVKIHEYCFFQLQENVKHKDYIDHQKDKVALTLARLARHVEVEKQQKEEKNRAFRVCGYFNWCFTIFGFFWFII